MVFVIRWPLPRRFVSGARITGLLVLLGSLPLLYAQAQPGSAPQSSADTWQQHDGRHDFDFELGHWKAHVKLLLHPLTHSTEWDELSGEVITRPLSMLEGWNVSEMKVDSPTTHKHIELLAVRLYNPSSHQWSIYGSSVTAGSFDPPMIGHFERGRGELYSQDMYEGKPIFVRFIWTRVSADHTKLEQAFSQDGGRTWETNWIYEGERTRG